MLEGMFWVSDVNCSIFLASCRPLASHIYTYMLDEPTHLVFKLVQSVTCPTPAPPPPAVTKAAKAGDPLAREFFCDEYQLDYSISELLVATDLSDVCIQWLGFTPVTP